VEGAGHLQRDDPRLLRLVRGERGGGHDLPAAVDVRRGQTELLQVGDDGVLVAAEDGGHAGLGDGGRLGHRQATLAYEAHRGRVVQHPGPGGCGDLAHAVARGGAHLGRELVPGGEELPRGDQTGGDQQRLGDGGVADLLRAGVRAVVHHVEPDDVGPLTELVLDTGEVEPGGQEARRLSALAGSDEYEHSHTLSC
jgi:hypothetical protein